MDRAALLALLGIPILVIVHVALFRQPIPGVAKHWTAAGDHLLLQGHWQSPEAGRPSYFVVEPRAERGS
jgi:hypothetical protein